MNFDLISLICGADEFSSQDEDEEDISGSKNSIERRTSVNENQSLPKIIGRCKAIYAYSPKLDDELEINPGENHVFALELASDEIDVCFICVFILIYLQVI